MGPGNGGRRKTVQRRRQALQAYLGPPIRPGRAADLVLLGATGAVGRVYIGGECVVRRVPG